MTGSPLHGADGWTAFTTRSVGSVTARDVIVAEGPDTVSFLHAVVSQDVAAMNVGESRWSFLLHPQGRLVSHFRLTRVDPERVVLDTEPGFGAALGAALGRYLIRTKCTLAAAQRQAVVRFHDEVSGPGTGRRVPGHPLVAGIDVFDPDPPMIGAAGVDPAILHYERVAAGLPHLGSDLDDTTIPNGTGLLASAVSFTKGCYVGQELVERIDARGGSAPTRLARLCSPRAEALETPCTVRHDSHTVTVTSFAPEPGGSGAVAIGIVPRAIADGAVIAVASMPFTVVGPVGA